MKRNFTKLFAAFALLMFLTVPIGMWGQDPVTMQYTGSTTTNMTGNNDAATVGLSASDWSVVAAKGSHSNFPGLGNDGTIRLYYNANGSNTITVTNLQDNTINSIVVTYNSNNYSNGTITVGGVAVSGTDTGNNNEKSYEINSTAFVIGNGNTTNTQVRINKIVINYTSSGSTTPTVATPTFNPAGGTYTAAQSVTISCTTEDATIYYTLDGNDPTTSSSVYSEALNIEQTTTVKAMAVKENYNNSAIAEATYTINVPTGDELMLTFNLTSNPGGWPTTNSSTIANYTYTLDDVGYTFALMNAKCNSGYLMVNYVGVVGLPAIDGYKLTKVVASNSGGCSTSTQVGISSSHSTANYIDGGEIQTWSTQSSNYTYTLTSTEANTMYYLYVTNKNAQITGLTLTYEPDASTPSPSITANGVNIAYDAENGEIAYTINNEVDGASLQATVADGATINNFVLGTVGASPITFTCAANTDNTAKTATVTLNYVKNSETLATKDVTITQAAAPLVYTTIPALFDAATSTATNVMVEFGGWVVSGVSTNGKNVFVTDNNGNGFVIYSSSSLAATYAVGNTLTGTTECSLKLNQGYAQLQNVDATDLTIEDGGTVTEQDIALANLAGVNTGALVSYEELTCSIDDSGNTPKYYLSDGTTTLQVYNSLYADAYTTLEAGKTYDITGVYQQYGNTKEILPRSADDIAEHVSPIFVENATVEVAGEGGEGLLTVLYTGVDPYYAEVHYFDENGEPADAPLWLNAGLDTDYCLTYAIGPNDGDARSAYLKIYVNGVYSNLVTITQLAFVADYAFLPFQYTDENVLTDGLNNMPNGLTQSGLGTYPNSTPRLKFDTADDELVLKLNGTPKAITFDIKGNGFSGGTFIVQLSEDGSTYENLATYTELGNTTQTLTFLNTNDNVRYIKWVYTVRQNGNVALGNIYVDDEYLVRGNATVSEDLTLIACEIESEGKLTIESGATFEVTEPYALYNGGNSTNLVIKDGGQLKTPNEVFATVEKDIIGYTQDNYYTNKGYYLVSAPAEKYLYVASSDADVDAYMFDASEEGEEWRNFKGAQGAWNISASSAILYATKENSTLSLDGKGIVYQANQSANEVANKVPATTTNIDIDIRFNSGKAFEGYNLIGNPFTCTAYLADDREFLRMNEDGDGFVWTSGAISVCEGIFVVAESSSDNKVIFTTTNPTDGNAGPAALTLNLTQSRGNVIDNARIRFGEGRNYAKFALNESNARVSFTQGNKEYSLVRSNGQGEMPVSFKAAQNGTYTLSFDMENVAFDNLRLIDNMTGVETDLLATPSYTFTARTTDYASRFRLVFSANNVNENTENDTFAYFNGSEWVINGSDNATVQVIDMMGRVVLSGTNTIATNDMQAGVYVIRLVDGNNVKTQKIVVE